MAPPASILLFALLRLAQARGAGRAFWGGFLALGLMALASVASCLLAPGSKYQVCRLWDDYFSLAHDAYERAVR